MRPGPGPDAGRLAASCTTRLRTPGRGRGGGPRRRSCFGTRGHEAPGPDVLEVTHPCAATRATGRSSVEPAVVLLQRRVDGERRGDDEAGQRLGQPVGGIQAENWRAWNFAVLDAAGTEVARITKTWEGLAKTLFTTADNYVVHVHFRLPDPLASMVIAAALTVDTALKQDSRGFN